MVELKGDEGTQAYGIGHSLYAVVGMHVRRALPRMQQVSGQEMPPGGEHAPPNRFFARRGIVLPRDGAARRLP